MMKEEQLVKQRPLMYISQPSFTSITAKMQQVVSKKKVKPKEELQEIEATNNVESQPNVTQHEIPTLTITTEKEKKDSVNLRQNESSEEQVPRTGNKKSRRKRFVELDLMGKVQFFVNLPINVPKSTCLITTETDNYKGKIIALNEGIVTIKTITEPNDIEIKFDDIKDIIIIGL